MDITHLFKAGVMSVKVQRKGELGKNYILSTVSSAPVRSDEFAKQVKDACNKITTLRNVLLENRSAYMRIGQHLKSAAQMNDEQRDMIDRESEKIVAYYTQHLAQMRAEWKHAKRKPQQHVHMEAVIDLLGNYLRSVQNIHLEQKKYRIRHELDTFRLLKLAADKKKIPVLTGSAKSIPDNKSKTLHSKKVVNGWHNDSDDSSDMDLDERWQHTNEHTTSSTVRRRANISNTNATTLDESNDLKQQQADSPQKVAVDEEIDNEEKDKKVDIISELSPDDIQMFEEENAQLYQQLQGLSEEVDTIERNVVDIAKLQDIFTEKISMQQHNIERIANAVVGATENVKDGNEQIKQAIQRNAGLRVWSLFFLLVMSFTLLFLDWYYD